MTSPKLPDYYEIEGLLASHHSLATPSQLDGVLCGLLCSGMPFENQDWVLLVMDYLRIDASENMVQVVLKALYQRSAERLAAQDFSFCLLAPGDEEPLAMRTQELGHWCEGFIAGDLLGKDDKRAEPTALIKEFMQDMHDIAGVEFDADEVSEEELEKAYHELVEFVRVGVQNVFSEQSKIDIHPDNPQELH
ncbi:MAG: hypothetical protein CMF25_06820 [Kangiellaceae bacterium]|jgi:uncharacterized protein YgfB (UPF0149 family)|nr:hypothetical protein [Kangiellaceae bacterium]|tara:strand:+ start:10857 stop:11432 length:576 start_codon:yes stop_codon:yes gene_type:complete